MRDHGGERRWRRRALVATGVVMVTGAVSVPIVLAPQAAEASELATFSSCEELRAWRVEAAAREAGGTLSDAVAVDQPATAGDAVTAAPESTRAVTGSPGGGTGGGTGDTNVAVAGVDELDVVDRIDDRRALVATGGMLALVDLGSATRLDIVPVPFDARITFDPGAGIVWVVGSAQAPVPGSGQEPAVGSGLDSIPGSEASMSSPSWIGGEVEVTRVAVGDDRLVVEGSWTTKGVLVDARRTGERLHVVAVDSAWTSGGGEVPFADGPVPCDQVLYPTAPSGGDATLVVTLPARGEVAPQAAAEVIGSGQLVHVTDDAVYLATPVWDGSAPRTGLHRFDAATLAHTGSGAVEGSLLNQYAMSDYEGFLRVALTHPIPFGRGNPEPAPAVDVAPGRPEVSDRGQPLNEVVVLDTDGELDVVGRTARFGHPGETLHGIRFVGAVAYAVTFLTTDPFYVVDVADPAAPAVVGKVELPGFSAYLHPIADGLVIGVGPGADGRATMRLFDVADPARPTVVDTEILGDDTPVTYDPHAFLGLGGGRVALPATSWSSSTTEPCPLPVPLPGDSGGGTSGGSGGADELVCSPSPLVETTIVVAGTASGAFDVEERIAVVAPEPGSRILAVGDRWALLAGDRLLTVDGAGEVVGEVDLA